MRVEIDLYGIFDDSTYAGTLPSSGNVTFSLRAATSRAILTVRLTANQPTDDQFDRVFVGEIQ